MGSSKNNNRTINDCSQILQRLNQALHLGTRTGRKWKCSDIQVQRQVIRSISAFLESAAIRSGTFLHPSLKDDILSDSVIALVWILENTNTLTLSSAADVALKLVTTLPRSTLKSHSLDFINSLSAAIMSHRPEIVIPCTKALSLVLSDLSSKDEGMAWGVLKEKETVRCCITYMQSFSFGNAKPVENFQSVASLLNTILRRFNQSRFLVWSDDNLMRTLNDVLKNPDSCSKVEALQLLLAIALCGIGAAKLLENGKSFLEAMVHCMGISQPESVRVEAFRLARHLTVNEERFSEMMRLYCEPFIQAILIGMTKASLSSGETSKPNRTVATEACQLASITRWSGDHHDLFWKHGIGNALLDLLVENSRNQFDRDSLSLEKHFSIALACLNSNHLPSLRSYLWDILGWLAIHGKKGFNPEKECQRFSVYNLVLSACSIFVDTIHKHQKVCQINLEDTLRSEPALRAVLMMIYSPCKYISSQAKSILSELLKQNGGQIFEHFLSTLKYILSREGFDRQQLIIYAMALACYLGLSETRRWVLEFSGHKLFLTLVRRCISRTIDTKEQSFSRSWHSSIGGQTCCDVYSEEWEGKDSLLFYSLFGLAELMKHFEGMKNNDAELVENLLREICTKESSHGVRWFASYALSSLGIYGFPRKVSRRIEKVLRDTYYSDTTFVLKSGGVLNVHGVVLAIRCPSLLRLENKESDSPREIRFSGCVDRSVLMKLLDFVYLGHLRASEEHMILLKSLAKHCNLSFLMQALSQRRPIWGSPYPSLDLSLALGPLGHCFSDVIFEAKTREIQQWTCVFCSSLVPHVHAHKVIMTASSDYFRALFTSGMQESLSQTIKLDLSWEAVVKLISWSYTDELPNPPIGCLWTNLSDDEKLKKLEPYLELCSLAKSLCIDEIEEACSEVIVSRLDSERQLAIKIIRIAFDFSLWDLVNVALSCAAPCYRQLLESGELDHLDEALVDMIRSASVQFTQEGNLELGLKLRIV